MGAEAKTAAAGATAQAAEEVNLLDKMLTDTKPLDDREKERNKDYIAEFLRQVVKPGQAVSKDVEATIKYWIGAIDNKLSHQLNEVMHSPEFQKL
jgi:type VI secretion system protein ImpC